MKKILVIGGAGYIGAHVVYDLVDEGHLVTVFDNLSTGFVENLPPSVNLIKGDIRRKKELKAAFTLPFDSIYHFAALKAVGDSMVEPEKFSDNNIIGTINILNEMVLHGIHLHYQEI